jgi:hypothetical protein
LAPAAAGAIAVLAAGALLDAAPLTLAGRLLLAAAAAPVAVAIVRTARDGLRPRTEATPVTQTRCARRRELSASEPAAPR